MVVCEYKLVSDVLLIDILFINLLFIEIDYIDNKNKILCKIIMMEFDFMNNVCK